MYAFYDQWITSYSYVAFADDACYSQSWDTLYPSSPATLRGVIGYAYSISIKFILLELIAILLCVGVLASWCISWCIREFGTPFKSLDIRNVEKWRPERLLRLLCRNSPCFCHTHTDTIKAADSCNVLWYPDSRYSKAMRMALLYQSSNMSLITVE